MKKVPSVLQIFESVLACSKLRDVSSMSQLCEKMNELHGTEFTVEQIRNKVKKRNYVAIDNNS